MRHRNQGKQLSRTASHRRAMLRNMVTSLFEHERITTTIPKAREARRVAERLITRAKRGDLHARRQVSSYLCDEKVAKKLFDEIADWYTDRPGGYTRILKIGNRLGDGGEIGILELVKTGELLEKDIVARSEAAERRLERKAERARSRAEQLAAVGGGAGEQSEADEDDKKKK